MMKNKHKQSSVFISLIVMFIIIVGILVRTSENNKSEGGNLVMVHESQSVDHNTIVPPANVLLKEEENKESNEENNKKPKCDEITYIEKWNGEDAYLLAKIAMAEAEGEDIETKVLVILTVLNRVESNEFPDTIKEVIFQNYKGVYQFSPTMPNGRWWRVEPNIECWEALDIVSKLNNDISNGALFFESCKGESWHSRNLEFICQSDNMRFYK